MNLFSYELVHRSARLLCIEKVEKLPISLKGTSLFDLGVVQDPMKEILKDFCRAFFKRFVRIFPDIVTISSDLLERLGFCHE